MPVTGGIAGRKAAEKLLTLIQEMLEMRQVPEP